MVAANCRASGAAVQLSLLVAADSVLKEVFNFSVDSRYPSIDHLRLVYAAAQSSPSLIHAVHPSPLMRGNTIYVVTLEPVGLPCSGPPLSEEEVKAGVRGALEGLKVLHASGELSSRVRRQRG